MVINSVLFKDFEVYNWLGPITMVTVYNDTMVMLYTYHFRCIVSILLTPNLNTNAATNFSA